MEKEMQIPGPHPQLATSESHLGAALQSSVLVPRGFWSSLENLSSH